LYLASHPVCKEAQDSSFQLLLAPLRTLLIRRYINERIIIIIIICILIVFSRFTTQETFISLLMTLGIT